MTSRVNIPFAAAAACVGLFAVAFANVASAEDAAPTPDAMSSDHLASDHMGMMKSPTKHVMKKQKHMTNSDAMSSDHMSSDHMAPEAPKQ